MSMLLYIAVYAPWDVTFFVVRYGAVEIPIIIIIIIVVVVIVAIKVELLPPQGKHT